MAVPVADLNRMRSRPQWQQWYLAVDSPATVWTAQVNDPGAALARGDYQIPVNGGVTTDATFNHAYMPGAFNFTDLWWHLTLWIGTVAGAKDVGIVQFHTLDAGGANMTVAANDITWADNQHLTLKWEIRPASVLPSIDGEYEDLEKIYNDENTNMKPLARIGPPTAGYLDAAGNFDVSFDSDDWSIIGAALAEYRWQFRNGVPNTSAVAAPGAVRYNAAGIHWVRHLVRDANNKFNIRLSRTYVYDAAHPAITDFTVNNLSGDRDSGGWVATVMVYQDASETDFPNLAEVVIFTDAYWNGTQNDVGYMSGITGGQRDNILFVGYIVKDSVYKDPETSHVTFEVASSVEIAKQCTCWGANFDNVAAPTSWHEIPSMNLSKAAFHCITEHSTFDHIQDIYLNLNYDFDEAAPALPITMEFIDLTEGPLYDHLKNGIGEAGRAVLLNSKYAQIFLEPSVQLSKVAHRDIDEMFLMGHDDWREAIDLGDEPSLTECAQVDFIGFYYDGSDPKSWGSLAPGRQWWHGNVQKVTGVRTNLQTDANTYCGIFERWFNNEFRDVHLPMAGFWPVFDIGPQRFLDITLIANDTNRELVWTGVRHVIKNVSLQFVPEGNYTLTDVTVEREVGIATGITNLIPEADPSPSPPPPPGPPPSPEAPTNYAVCVLNEDQVFRASDFFTAASPSWDDLDPNNDLVGMFVNIAAYQNEAYVTTMEVGNEANTGLWYCSNTFAAAPGWTLIKSNQAAAAEGDGAGANNYVAQIAAAKEVYLGAVYMSGSDCAVCLHSKDPPGAGGCYYIATGGAAGGIQMLAIPPQPPGTGHEVFFKNDHMNFCVWADAATGGTFYFACGTNGANGAYVYDRGADNYIFYNTATGGPIDEWGFMVAVADGYAVSWGQNQYGPGWALALYDINVLGRLGIDTVASGVTGIKLRAGGGGEFYINTNYICDSDDADVFDLAVGGAGNPQGCFTTFYGLNTYLIWISGDQCQDGGPAGWGDRFIIYTADAGLSGWDDKTGDFFNGGLRNWTGWDRSDRGNSVVRIFVY